VAAGIINNRVNFEPTAPDLEGGKQTITLLQSRFYKKHQFEYWPIVMDALAEQQQQWKARREKLQVSDGRSQACMALPVSGFTVW
jgi:hypothetical protein